MSKVTPPAGAVRERLTRKGNVVVSLSPSFKEPSLMVMVGGGACTIVVAVAELLTRFGSDVREATVAVLVIVTPAALLTEATTVMIAEAPGATEGKVIVRSLPEPPQTPSVAEHETKVTVPGKVSVTMMDSAMVAPLLATAMV